MTELLTAAQMRAIEAAAIDGGVVTGLQLMERAGQGVVDAVLAEWPELAEGQRRAVVLCGPGNNGGDGFVVARLLKKRGWAVDVFLYGDAGRLPPDARANYERWVETGAVAAFNEQGVHIPEGTCLVVDAIFGTGLTRPADDKALGRAFRDLCDCAGAGGGLALHERVKLGFPLVVAVDVPSGLCADSGRVLGEGDRSQGSRAWAVAADMTISFHSLKAGHVLADGPALAGKVVVCDIGLDARAARRVLGSVPKRTADQERDPSGVIVGLERAVYTARLVQEAGILDKKADRHKYSHGHALILSGGPSHTGAARLAARGALRIGAGLVTVGSSPDALAENAAQLTAVMLTGVHDGDALNRVLDDTRINALCIGPALGMGEREAGLVLAALDAERAMVLDADALTLVAADPTLFARLHSACVLTPHAGEFARLFPDIAARLAAPATTGPAYSKVDATREAAKRAGCTVLFKGPDTVIASPDGRCSVNASVYDRAAPWLATAGAGDVLAGFITGLLARGFAPHEAAEAGAWLHTECARSFGPGLIAEDLPEELPKVLRDLF